MATYRTIRDNASATNATVYTLPASGLTIGDFPVVFIAVSGKAAVGTLTDNRGLGWTFVTSVLSNSSTDILEVYVGNGLLANTSMTLTYTVNGVGNANGAIPEMVLIAGMSRVGAAALVQSAQQDNQAAATPAPAFGAAAQSFDITLGCVINASSPAALTEPSGWTERQDEGLLSPNMGFEVVTRDSGFTGSTVTWGSSSATTFGAVVLELDSTAVVAGSFAANAVLKGNQSRTFTGNADLKKNLSGSFSADATIALHAFASLAVIKRTSSSSMTARAIIVGRRRRHFRDRDHQGALRDTQVALLEAIGRYPAGSLLSDVIADMNARIIAARHEPVGSLSTAAVTKRTQMSSFTARAIVHGPTTTSAFTAYARLLQLNHSVSADAVIV